MATDFYAVLGVPRNATEQQIRQRFTALVRERHPDRFQGEEKRFAEESFQAITEAFNVLGNPERRRLYDAEVGRPDVGRGGQENEVGRVYMQRGVKAYKARKYLEAADNFDRATKAEPQNAKAWHSLALACSQQRRWLGRAMAAIARACELEPMKVSYLKAAGRIHTTGGEHEKAAHFFRQAIQWGGDDPEIAKALEEIGARSKPGQGRSRFTGFLVRSRK